MSSTTPRPVAVSPAVAVSTRSVHWTWRDWLELTKPEITFLVAISSLAGFLFGSPGELDWTLLTWTIVGVILTSAGGSALNHWLERDLDARMRRTADRPLPSGRVSGISAFRFGVLLVAAGLALICPLVNPLTGVLAAATVALYLFVYTPLKRVTPLNTLVGTVPGALPALGGWTAATGSIDATGWIVFAVLVCWQIPHFFSLAWMYRQDYARARYAMLPVMAPDGNTTVAHMIVFSVLLLAASLLPLLNATVGITYAIGCLVLAAGWVRPLAAFSASRSNIDARRVLKATIWYIPGWVLLIIVDRIVGF